MSQRQRDPRQVRQTVHIVFPDAPSAEYLVAGLPLAARIVQALVRDEPGLAISAGVTAGSWTPSRRCAAECARLGDAATLRLGSQWAASEAVRTIDAMSVLAQIVARARADGGMSGAEGSDHAIPPNPAAALREADQVLLRATAKPQDGMISRTFNRPVSRAITRVLLRFATVKPIHATAGTALLALLMLAVLLAWPGPGAIIGALLYQAASVYDGVDGEIARATFRTSPAGARLDSLIDAATNLAFIAGLSFNFWQEGNSDAALAGLFGMVLLLAGLTQIGRRAQRMGEPINFEAVKVHLRRNPSRRWLVDLMIWLTMRDFIAFATALLALIGKVAWVPFIFLSCAVCWFTAISVILARSGTTNRA